jgi:hypothetical protein
LSKKGKLTANQREYQRVRKNLLQRESRLRKQGYVFESQVPESLEELRARGGKVTKKALERIASVTAKSIKRYAEYILPETGELVSAAYAKEYQKLKRKQERERKKAEKERETKIPEGEVPPVNPRDGAIERFMEMLDQIAPGAKDNGQQYYWKAFQKLVEMVGKAKADRIVWDHVEQYGFPIAGDVYNAAARTDYLTGMFKELKLDEVEDYTYELEQIGFANELSDYEIDEDDDDW